MPKVIQCFGGAFFGGLAFLVGSSPIQSTYSFWVRCGATSICDGIFVILSVGLRYHLFFKILDIPSGVCATNGITLLSFAPCRAGNIRLFYDQINFTKKKLCYNKINFTSKTFVFRPGRRRLEAKLNHQWLNRAQVTPWKSFRAVIAFPLHLKVLYRSLQYFCLVAIFLCFNSVPLQRDRGLWMVSSNYGWVVCFWYFQDIKWTQKRTITPMPSEIDDNMFFTP